MSQSRKATRMETRTDAPPTLWEELFPGHASNREWQLGSAERFVLGQMLSILAPKRAIEVGTYQGGSLELLARHSEKVYSIDIDPDVRARLSGLFENVELLTGDSKVLLPQLLASLEQQVESADFVLIDGDHSAEGVRTDIDNVLRHRPTTPLYIVMHDSFNPDCRRGILEADWAGCPYVRAVEVDYVPGTIFDDVYDTAMPPGTMYGGFAVAFLDPWERDYDLVVAQSRRSLYEATRGVSIYAGGSAKLAGTGLKRLFRALKGAH